MSDQRIQEIINDLAEKLESDAQTCERIATTTNPLDRRAFGKCEGLRLAKEYALELLQSKQEQQEPEPLTDRERDRAGFYTLVSLERARQDEKWGYPQLNTFCEWGCILGEEFGESAKELNELNFGRGNKERLIEELVQTAAVCLSIVEHYDVANAYATEPKGEATT